MKVQLRLRPKSTGSGSATLKKEKHFVYLQNDDQLSSHCVQSQAYCPSREAEEFEPEESVPRGPEVVGSRRPEVLSPGSDQVESEHSGSTETGLPVQMGVCLLNVLKIPLSISVIWIRIRTYILS